MAYETLEYSLLTKPPQTVKIPATAPEEADKLLSAAHPFQGTWEVDINNLF
ncbi:MAG: hypothetical protein RL557_193, partial [archaeon]